MNGAGALSRRGLLLAVPRAFRQAGDDAELLSAAVSLEWVAAGTYDELTTVAALRPETRQSLARLAVQERDHAGLLASALSALGGGARAPAPPAGGRALAAARARAGLPAQLGEIRTEAGVIAVALELENALIAGYHMAIGRLSDQRLVTVAAQIMGAESQHAVVVRGIATDDPALLVPGAFEVGTVRSR